MIRPKLSAAVLALAFALASAAIAQVKLHVVDLQPQGNHVLAEDLHETPGNNLAAVPKGELAVGDVKFTIAEKLVHARGNNTNGVPKAVSGIAVGDQFDKLHVLHACGYAGEVPNGTTIGAYVLTYADDTTARLPIVIGAQIRDWWSADETPITGGKIAWTGKNDAASEMGLNIRLFAVAYDNPHPDKVVKSLALESSDTDADPFLVALTIEKK